MKMQLFVMMAAAGWAVTSAAGEMPDAQGGMYVEGLPGPTLPRLSESAQHISDNTAGARIAVGKRFDARLGVEGGYTHFGKMDGNLGMVAAKAEPKAVYLAATYTLPLTDKLSSQFKPGVSRTGTTGSVAMDKDVMIIDTRRVGAGMDVGVSYALVPNGPQRLTTRRHPFHAESCEVPLR
jgi:hypothetical protein